jgi:hypothetical protein
MQTGAVPIDRACMFGGGFIGGDRDECRAVPVERDEGTGGRDSELAGAGGQLLRLWQLIGERQDATPDR